MYALYVLFFANLEIKRHFPLIIIIMIMMKLKPLILVFFSMFLVLHYLTNQTNSDSYLGGHTGITTPLRPPPPRKTYCSKSSSSPPPPKYMYVTGVPGELYRTEPDDQWGYNSSVNRNLVKCLLVIVIVGFGVINLWKQTAIVCVSNFMGSSKIRCLHRNICMFELFSILLFFKIVPFGKKVKKKMLNRDKECQISLFYLVINDFKRFRFSLTQWSI